VSVANGDEDAMDERHQWGVNVWVIAILLAVSVGAGTKLTKPPNNPPPVALEAKAARVMKEFPSYQVMGRRWRNVVVSPDNSLEALTALVKQLHAEDPKSSLEIFTDGDEQQFRRYMRWATRPTRSSPHNTPTPKPGRSVTASPWSRNF
jgi:hypothetical protein